MGMLTMVSIFAIILAFYKLYVAYYNHTPISDAHIMKKKAPQKTEINYNHYQDQYYKKISRKGIPETWIDTHDDSESS